MNPQQLTNERFLSDIKSLNKTIEAQAAEIAKLQSQLEHLETVASGRLDEVAKLRGLLERWQEFSGVCYTTMIFDQPYRLKSKEGKLDGLVKDTTEALK